MGSLGIIAAAGKATRFNGILKELLPVDGGMSLLERHIRQMYGVADQIVVVSSIPKIAAHAAVTEKFAKVSLTLQKRPWDIYGAMYAGMWIPHERVYFAMADTYLPQGAHTGGYGSACPLKMGMFWTDTPYRYGVLHKGRIRNKECMDEYEGTQFKAWGVLSWDKEVTKRWFSEGYLTYTDALNIAIEEFPTDFYTLDFYHDMASWEDYWRLINETGFSKRSDSGDREVPRDNPDNRTSDNTGAWRGGINRLVC